MKVGIDDDSMKYLNNYDEEGYIYLSIDGNNRSIALRNSDNEILEKTNLKCIKENIVLDY